MTWLDETRDGVRTFRPTPPPEDVVVAFSGRGHAPEGEPTPTPYLARRLARAIGLDGTPIHWGKQVHGTAVSAIRESASAGSAACAGECDVLATDRVGTALVVQTADCVPILLAAPAAVAAAHAGWRGTAKNAAGEAVAALRRLGADPATVRAWLGPSIGPCCYEVGGEVAAQFAGEFARRSCNGRFTLDLPAVNRAQLEAAGVPAANITRNPACTRCGGEKFASYRRDGAAAGRMITLVALRPPLSS